jgi:hypothetical protein
LKAGARAAIPTLIVLWAIAYAIAAWSAILFWAVLVVLCVLWGAVLYEPRKPDGDPPPNVPS